MTAGVLSDRGELRALFDELAAELRALDASAEIVMVGGSWLLWHELRPSTRDVDSARRFEADLAKTITRIGKRHDLKDDWLNDRAAAFWPAGASYDDCEIVYSQSPLVVRAPEPEVIFVMKLYRASPPDREDLVALWPLCDFKDAHAAAEAFRSAYPHAYEDEQLAEFIAEIARDAVEDQEAD